MVLGMSVFLQVSSLPRNSPAVITGQIRGYGNQWHSIYCPLPHGATLCCSVPSCRLQIHIWAQCNCRYSFLLILQAMPREERVHIPTPYRLWTHRAGHLSCSQKCDQCGLSSVKVKYRVWCLLVWGGGRKITEAEVEEAEWSALFPLSVTGFSVRHSGVSEKLRHLLVFPLYYGQYCPWHRMEIATFILKSPLRNF